MGCLLALLAGFAPRVALALVWIFTNWVDRAFNGFLIPLLGLIVFTYASAWRRSSRDSGASPGGQS